MTQWPDIDRRRLGAISILLGNAAVFANGLIANRFGEDLDMRNAGVGRMASAALTSGAGLIIGRYGSSPVAAQLGRLEKKLAAFMKRHGMPLDAELLKKADEETRKGWFSKLEDFAYDHPMECGNIYNAVAALGMLGSGFLRRRRGELQSGNANIINYLMILAGTLWGKMQEKPLNFAVWPFLGADISFGGQAYGEYKTAKQLPENSSLRPWMFIMSGISAFTMVAAVVGDVLTGFSSKKVGGNPKDREEAQNELIDKAARILASQPVEVQSQLAKEAAEYLSQQQGLRMADFDADALVLRILQSIARQQELIQKETPRQGRF